MKRILVFALLIVLTVVVLVALTKLGIVPVPGSGPRISRTLYDTDADGTADLVRTDIQDTARLWRWDRDADGTAEIIAYDAVPDGDQGSRPTGSITAWDVGADGVLEQGTVPESLQALLRSEPVSRALQQSAGGQVELVDESVRQLVRQMRSRFDEWRLSGFRLPILGAKLPDADRLLPGAPRRYRYGTHQGFDMYPGHIGTPTGYGGPVVAAKSGTVIRADLEYQDMSPEQYQEIIARSQAAGTTPPRELDLLRGRQIWIDHGHGIVTRYAHLSSIAPEIKVGVRVDGGQIIGYVGNSGTEAATHGSRAGAHLHFELQIDGHYFGEGMPATEIRALARRIFSLPEE